MCVRVDRRDGGHTAWAAATVAAAALRAHAGTPGVPANGIFGDKKVTVSYQRWRHRLPLVLLPLALHLSSRRCCRLDGTQDSKQCCQLFRNVVVDVLNSLYVAVNVAARFQKEGCIFSNRMRRFKGPTGWHRQINPLSRQPTSQEDSITRTNTVTTTLSVSRRCQAAAPPRDAPAAPQPPHSPLAAPA